MTQTLTRSRSHFAIEPSLFQQQLSVPPAIHQPPTLRSGPGVPQSVEVDPPEALGRSKSAENSPITRFEGATAASPAANTFAQTALSHARQLTAEEHRIKRVLLDALDAGDLTRVRCILRRWLAVPTLEVIEDTVAE